MLPVLRQSATVYRSVCSGEAALKGTNAITAVTQSAPTRGVSPASYRSLAQSVFCLPSQKINARNISKSVAFQQHKLYNDY
jgi:hypothetical protein